jgi:hypothetical protein
VSERPPIPNDFGHRWRHAVLHSAATNEDARVAWVLLDSAYTHKSTVVNASRRELAYATGLDERSVRRALANLVGLGFLALEERGTSKASASVWRLLEPGAIRAGLERQPGAEPGAEPGAIRAHDLPSPSPSPNSANRALARAPANDVDVPITQALVAFYIDTWRAEGVEPPRRLVGQTAREIGKLVDEGYTSETIAEALRLMIAARITSPTALPKFILEAQAGPRRDREHPVDRNFREATGVDARDLRVVGPGQLEVIDGDAS